MPSGYEHSPDYGAITFPATVQIGNSRVGYLFQEIEAYIDNRASSEPSC
jgi:predicted DNA-binding transcriptional regulator AlpA